VARTRRAASLIDCPSATSSTASVQRYNRASRATRWFVNYRKQVGVYRPGVAMHAFRHTANTRLRDAMTTEQHRRHINHLLSR